ncbi:MAG TPA: hypothetical protein VD903_18515, partial [Pseudonocardia sp.]|nr:hypothetical protein [Pseudonocardia sp.]
LPEEGWSGGRTVPDGRASHLPSVPQPREAVPAHDAVLEATATTTPSGLPRRGASPRGPDVEPMPPSPVAPPPVAPSRPAPPTVTGTTASGLPRRVSRSIKDSADADSAAAPAPERDAADPDGHEKFLADLGDFSEGERAARATEGDTGRDTDEGDGDPR